ncbi:pilus assembly protein [Hyphomicrobium sp.]|uniref:TadE/TadG family type IV pilus assembly protein n=1 Tax=Hyphomicrobium sp. TaxID=82 RepID=UPI0025BE33DD|nr:pilus assembly protein [Hyphomicrobium sp.]MCC7251307.1 pilus assembly protein [Hyphomicrobium sp.]
MAAVEFAFIVPILLLMMIGTFEITRAISIDRKFSIVTTMVADLVAREEKLTKDDITAIYDVVENAMAPYDVNALTLSIIPVAAAPEDASKTAVYAADTNRPSYNGGAAPAVCDDYLLPTGLVGQNQSVIVVEGGYKFMPLIVGYVMGGSNWSKKAISVPRKRACVDFDQNGKPCGACFE